MALSQLERGTGVARDPLTIKTAVNDDSISLDSSSDDEPILTMAQTNEELTIGRNA